MTVADFLETKCVAEGCPDIRYANSALCDFHSLQIANQIALTTSNSYVQKWRFRRTYTRLDLMGVGKSESERSPAERRLSTIVFCAPLERVFDGRDDADALYSLQNRFHEQRRFFITAMDERKLRGIAARILGMDRTLSRCCTGWR